MNSHLQTNTEEKVCGEMTYELSVINRLIMHYSTLPRLLRAISWWRRLICVFYNRIKRNKIDAASLVKFGPVTVVKYNQSLLVAIRCAQKQAFGDLIDALEKGDCHDIEAGRYGNRIKGMLKPLRAYCPFVEDRVLRIGRRLQKSDLPYDTKHPFVLPRRHYITWVIIADAHVKCGHFSANYVLNELCGLKRLQKKWPFNDLALRGIEFYFNPPLASHQVGVFESIIHLVRKVMTALMDDEKLHNLTDDGLETLFREIQLILNGRPLSRVSADPDDLCALTPKSILTGSVDAVSPYATQMASFSSVKWQRFLFFKMTLIDLFEARGAITDKTFMYVYIQYLCIVSLQFLISAISFEKLMS